MISVTERLEMFLLFSVVKDCTFRNNSSPVCWTNTSVQVSCVWLTLTPHGQEVLLKTDSYTKPSEFTLHHRQAWILSLTIMNIGTACRAVIKHWHCTGSGIVKVLSVFSSPVPHAGHTVLECMVVLARCHSRNALRFYLHLQVNFHRGQEMKTLFGV